jgi:hypothetical protein
MREQERMDLLRKNELGPYEGDIDLALKHAELPDRLQQALDG